METKTCSIEGCSAPAKCRGWCPKHYMRCRRHGDPLKARYRVDPTLPLSERFWLRVDRQGADDCWEWQGSTRGKMGYGNISWQGRMLGTHRVSWTLHNGPIPEGGHVLHKCDNPPCCNPAHLFLGDNAANVADKMAKGRHRYDTGEDHPRSKMTWERVRELRRRSAAGVPYSVLARTFNISKATVGQIVTRRTWK